MRRPLSPGSAFSAWPQTAAAPQAEKATQRSVALVGDDALMSAAERMRKLAHLIETHPNAKDNYLKGGAIETLEAAMAAMLGKEDAAFLATGTLANNLAVRLLCGENRHALCHFSKMLRLDQRRCDREDCMVRPRLCIPGQTGRIANFRAREWCASESKDAA